MGNRSLVAGVILVILICLGQGVAGAGFFSFGEKKDTKAQAKREERPSNSQNNAAMDLGSQEVRPVAEGSLAEANNAFVQLPTTGLPLTNPAANVPKAPSIPRVPSMAKVNVTTPVKPPVVVRPMVPTRSIPPSVTSANRDGALVREAKKNLTALNPKNAESAKAAKA
jgi:hypothetical protein